MLSKIKKIIKLILKAIYQRVFPRCYQTRATANPITLKTLFIQKVLGFNRHAYWPTHHSSVVNNPENILIGIGTAPGLAPGCYIQALGKIYIGDYTLVAANVGLISSNHNIYNYREHDIGQIVIGKYCWIGMNAVILPNVTLGDFTIVAAGSVVTKSFADGSCIIAGNPAKIIKTLETNKCVRYKDKYEYIGYYKVSKFATFRKKCLNV